LITPCELAACDRSATFLQSAFWGEFKAQFGWRAFAFEIAGSGEGTPLLVLWRPLFPGISFAYIPWGALDPMSVESAVQELRSYLPRDTAFVRYDPPWFTEGPETPAPTLGAPFERASADVQPPDTVLVDLSNSENNILKHMKPKWRYNIKLASKRGVQVRQAGAGGLSDFYALFKETAARDGIAAHSETYYRTLFDLASKNGGPDFRLYLAEHEGDKLAAIITLFRPPVGTYLYGASSNRKLNLMATYALQWQAMRDAKSAGCTVYDLFGVPPNSDPGHPMHGLYLFKTGFGGRIIHRPGSWDFAYKPAAAALFRMAEKTRKKLRDRKKIRK
jgi:lipid II:glycine glycyltransferase (peptidoglycan interpeptide bridge formation enzyme)